MGIQSDLGLGSLVTRGKDIFLSYTGSDRVWVERLAEKIESVKYKDRYLGVVFDKWDFQKGKNIVLEIEHFIDECRFIGLVVTRAMLAAEWPTLERSIAIWSDPAGNKGRVLTLLLENVDLPPTLRIRNWIDFRNPERFEESFLELISVLREEPIRRGRGGLSPTVNSTLVNYAQEPLVIAASSEADRVTEELVSNLLPVTELPTVVQSAETALRVKSEVQKYIRSNNEPVPPFILRAGKLYSYPVEPESLLALVILGRGFKFSSATEILSFVEPMIAELETKLTACDPPPE